MARSCASGPSPVLRTLAAIYAVPFRLRERMARVSPVRSATTSTWVRMRMVPPTMAFSRVRRVAGGDVLLAEGTLGARRLRDRLPKRAVDDAAAVDDAQLVEMDVGLDQPGHDQMTIDSAGSWRAGTGANAVGAVFDMPSASGATGLPLRRNRSSAAGTPPWDHRSSTAGCATFRRQQSARWRLYLRPCSRP
jgi:hypothetical protein